MQLNKCRHITYNILSIVYLKVFDNPFDTVGVWANIFKELNVITTLTVSVYHPFFRVCIRVLSVFPYIEIIIIYHSRIVGLSGFFLFSYGKYIFFNFHLIYTSHSVLLNMAVFEPTQPSPSQCTTSSALLFKRSVLFLWRGNVEATSESFVAIFLRYK